MIREISPDKFISCIPNLIKEGKERINGYRVIRNGEFTLLAQMYAKYNDIDLSQFKIPKEDETREA